MSTQHPAVVLDGITLLWPDGAVALSGLDAAFNPGRTGLVGTNGAGKSTLLRVVAGELTPAAGSVSVRGQVRYLPQHITLQADATVADLLGVRDRLDALRAIESGDADPRHFDALADDWGVEERARAALGTAGLPDLDLDRRVATLSGGETVATALTGIGLSGAEIALLDEPTNNLDREARRRLYDLVAGWRGTLVVASHDLALLDLMDETAELRDGSLTVYGGPYSAFREHVEREQAAAEQALSTAEQKLRTEKRQRVEAQTKLARRQRYARTDYENKRRPKTIMKLRAGEAEVSAGKLRGELDEKVDRARELRDRTAERVRRDPQVKIDLPAPELPTGRRVAELHSSGSTIVVQGPERLALTGRNGAGKTQLVETLVGPRAARQEPYGTVLITRIGHLPQRLDHLDDAATILETVRSAQPEADPEEVRATLAGFGFRGDVVHRRIGDVSGGERFRVALATVLLLDPPIQLLVLDEPTNNLDIATVEQVVAALGAYRGALIVISHDDAFLDRLSIDTYVHLENGRLSASRRLR
ncbi:ABC-F family ATP-binding cassette domain-containing protein [Nocardioides albus]|uniref:ATPase subunit of ABC transporter with duplicated ATPase domains n=1 Tax=Nocardioides albus TaxID=1841 RepID=A0A7W5A4T4_9ACTN|nr:ATP-binding cassette domain-containing protein [Nocardioides albus]MBB3089505.1 ATPase subunit of ABC transporter with duplicated ATPase domains [Nocardioides albus]GGU31275.1 ABC transporter [Nocardioides albus]